MWIVVGQGVLLMPKYKVIYSPRLNKAEWKIIPKPTARIAKQRCQTSIHGAKFSKIHPMRIINSMISAMIQVCIKVPACILLFLGGKKSQNTLLLNKSTVVKKIPLKLFQRSYESPLKTVYFIFINCFILVICIVPFFLIKMNYTIGIVKKSHY